MLVTGIGSGLLQVKTLMLNPGYGNVNDGGSTYAKPNAL